jgi:hypothetical protein
VAGDDVSVSEQVRDRVVKDAEELLFGEGGL